MFTDSLFSSTSSSDDNDIQATEGFDTIRNKHPKDLFLAYLHTSIVSDTKLLASEMPVDILAIAETKLDNSFPNAQFHINGYRLFRNDSNHDGGGVLVYVRSDIHCRQIREPEQTCQS